MFVYRAENFKDPDYIKKKRQEDHNLVEEELKYYYEALAKAKLEYEKLLANKENILEEYAIYTKPINELTKTERKLLIKRLAKVNILENDGNDIDDEELDSLRKIANIFISNPLDEMENSVKYYTDAIKETKEIYSKYFLVALNSESINRENIDLLLEQIRRCKAKGLKVRVGIDSDMRSKKNDSNVDYMYSREEMMLLLEVDNELKNNGYEGIVFSEMNEITKFEDFDKKWSLEEVVKANRHIDEYSKYILDNKLSPFEAMLYIHKMATKYVYKDKDLFEGGRVLPSIINDQDIVCAGYASFVKAIIDRVNLPGLKCDIQGCAIGKNGKYQGHCHNVIHIEDEKYDINGTYIEDACWDSRSRQERKGKGFGHCLYPVKDLLNFNNDIRYVDTKSDTRMSNLIFDTKDYMDVLKEVYGTPLEKIKIKIARMIKRSAPCKVVEMYGDKSAPIDIEKYKEALRNVFRTKSSDEEKIEELVNEDIENSINNSLNTFNHNASNTFTLQVDRKTKKEKEKNSKGPSATM